MVAANRRPFDPTRYKNRASAKSAARNYESKGKADRAEAIRRYWKIGEYANGRHSQTAESQDTGDASGFHVTGDASGTGEDESAAEDTDAEDHGFVFEVEDAEGSVGEESPAREESPVVEASPMSASEAKDLAGVFLSMLQLIAVSWTGSTQARMTKDERDMIQPALQRMLIKHVKAAKHLATISDPLALVMGFAMWGRRVASLRTPAAPPAPAYHVPASPREEQPEDPQTYHRGDVTGEVMTDQLMLTLFPDQGI